MALVFSVGIKTVFALPIAATNVGEDNPAPIIPSNFELSSLSIHQTTQRILLDPMLVREIRDAQKICTKIAFKKGRRITQNTICNSWKRRVSVLVRWIQNSKLYPFQPLQKIESQESNFELAKAESPNASTFASPETIEFIKSVGDFAVAEIGKTVKVTALTTGPEHKSDYHQTHLTGYAFDVRPFPGDVPTTWKVSNKKLYNQDMNRDFILKLASEPQVKKIIFNDPKIYRDNQIKRVLAQRQAKGYEPLHFINDTEICIQKKWRGCDLHAHDNHIHVELHMPQGLESIAQELLEGTNTKTLRTTGLKLKYAPQPYSNSFVERSAFPTFIPKL